MTLPFFGVGREVSTQNWGCSGSNCEFTRGLSTKPQDGHMGFINAYKGRFIFFYGVWFVNVYDVDGPSIACHWDDKPSTVSSKRGGWLPSGEMRDDCLIAKATKSCNKWIEASKIEASKLADLSVDEDGLFPETGGFSTTLDGWPVALQMLVNIHGKQMNAYRI